MEVFKPPVALCFKEIFPKIGEDGFNGSTFYLTASGKSAEDEKV